MLVVFFVVKGFVMMGLPVDVVVDCVSGVSFVSALLDVGAADAAGFAFDAEVAGGGFVVGVAPLLAGVGFVSDEPLDETMTPTTTAATSSVATNPRITAERLLLPLLPDVTATPGWVIVLAFASAGRIMFIASGPANDTRS